MGGQNRYTVTSALSTAAIASAVARVVFSEDKDRAEARTKRTTASGNSR